MRKGMGFLNNPYSCKYAKEVSKQESEFQEVFYLASELNNLRVPFLPEVHEWHPRVLQCATCATVHVCFGHSPGNLPYRRAPSVLGHFLGRAFPNV